MLGNETTLSRDYYFLTELAVALCFFSHYTVSYQFDKGHVFMDRLYQKPILVDMWQEDKQFMNARNGFYVAGTGGGKSVTAANVVQQNIEEGTKTIVVEFGQSFASLIKLYPDKSFHFKYDGTTPLGINPFIVDDHKKVTNDKIRTLAVLVLKFWGVKKIREDDHQVNSVNMVLKNYYKNTVSNHSFPDFYDYVEANHERILAEEKIDNEYFDTKSFLHQCRRFIKGGVYENVTTVGDLEKTITTKDFVVFELTEIKKDPFLMSIVMLILFDTVENKILSDRSVRGEMIFDEYAETAQIRDMLSGEDIHSTVAFCFQKFRKENGAVKIIVQSPSQLPDNEFTKSIIANTQLLIVLPTDDVVYNAIVRLFEMEDQQQIRLMKSIGRNYRTEHPYNEIFISFSFRMVMVVRLELSPRKKLAYQTDGKDWSWITARHKELSTADNSMSSIPMETAILEYQQLSKQQKN
jgi:type IV secretory pathway VirB4 component